jgi:hypothetical protein
MSAGYGNNPYVLNIVPLFGVAGSASGSAASASGLTEGGGGIATNTISTFDSGNVQFTSPVLIDVGGVVVQLQAKIAELEARIVALGG